jgi:sporulation protein YunB
MMITFILLSIISLFLLGRLNDYLMPTVLEIAEQRIIAQMSEIISNSYNEVITDVKPSDLYETYYNNSEGKIESVDVNTLLVNEICNQLAAQVSTSLNKLSAQSIDVPLGALTGYQIFASHGPSYTVNVQPMGSALVNPEYNKSTLGINQVSIQLWLNVRCNVRLAIPLYTEKTIQIERDLQLVDKLISQDVPDAFWGNQGGTSSQSEK